MKKSDNEIKRDVEEELRWDPDITPTDIAVAVKDGVVELTGFVHNYSDRWLAEVVAKRVTGVLGAANDIEVRLPSSDQRPDPEIARDAVAELRRELPYSHESIKPVAKQGWVTLEGEVEWNYQRQRAEVAVRRIRGILGVSNMITLKPEARPSDIKRKIEDAFRRSAEIDANRISVDTQGGEVTLKGHVRSWTEREEAERTAWAAPGVTGVNNEIRISA